jgi:urease accessory protein
LTGDRILVSDVGSLAIGLGVAREIDRSAVLHFSVDEQGRTHIAKQFAPYPFHVCRPFYVCDDPPGMATVYIQSCAGGIFEHDRLGLTVQTEPGSKAHVTTSASTIVHGMPNGEAKQSVNLIADSHSVIEYLPDPMILFPGASMDSTVNVILHEEARVILSDAFLLHDHRGLGDAFERFRSEITIRDASGMVLVRDRIRVEGRSMLARRPGVTDRFIAQASFLCLIRDKSNELLAALRSALDSIDDIYGGVSLLPGGVGVYSRVLAADGVSLRTAQFSLWSRARKYLTGVMPTSRRK